MNERKVLSDESIDMTDTAESPDQFDKQHEYERVVIYDGPTNSNLSFGSSLVEHFSSEEFLIFIDRCESCLAVRLRLTSRVCSKSFYGDADQSIGSGSRSQNPCQLQWQSVRQQNRAGDSREYPHLL
jgi:hypothetical protein